MFITIILVMFRAEPIASAAIDQTPLPKVNQETVITDPANGNGTVVEDEKDNPWYMPQWVEDLIEKINGLFQNFQDLMSGKLIYEAIQGLIVMMVDDMISPLFGAFSKSYLFTPQLAEIGLVYKGWSLFMYICLASIMLGVLWLASKVIKGKVELKSLLITFLICLPVIYYSLTALNFANIGVNWITQNMLAGTIGTEGISYQGLTGEQILKAMFLGKDGITDPTYEGMTLGNIVIATPGGIFTLLAYIAVIVFPLYLISVIKMLLLICLAIFVPFWINYTAYTGKMETLVGFVNLYLRSLLAGFLCALHFAIFVRIQSDYGVGEGIAAEIGVPPVIFAMLAVIFLFAVLFFLWIRPVWRAVKDPITLSGGKAIEGLGNWGERASLASNRLGKRMGAETLQKRSLNWAEASRKMQSTGKRMQQQQSSLKDRALSKITGGASEAIQNIKYSAPKSLAQESGSVVLFDDSMDLNFDETIVESSSTNLYSELKKSGYSQANLLNVDEGQRRKMTEQLQHLSPEYKDLVEWNEATGELVTIGEAKQGVVGNLKQLGFNVASQVEGMSRDGVFVGLETKKVHKMLDTEKAETAIQKINTDLQTYTKANLPSSTAKSIYSQLQNVKDDLPWVKNLKMIDEDLHIDTQDVDEAKPYIEKMLTSPKDKVRYNMPRSSKFLNDMITDWKYSPNRQDLVKALEVNPDKNVVYVDSAHRQEFTKAVEEYQKDRTPYWRTKDGKTFVIMDGIPIDHGAPPTNGINMGSFEEFQKDMIQHHQEQKLQNEKVTSTTKK
ncbi:hypothetical protein FHR92_002986 [Fontibacillus solani]|uniref:Uncharacterized protein n=2 Tax=Fontibacillus solani TaxID=1572857 RepID=A0A7W3XSF3_9BACL|nr:hypothetical protein [Fontibacillus solani]